MTWQIALQTAGQSFFILWFVLLGLKFIGRRAFGELGPQDFVLIMLISEAMDVGLTPEGGGFWGSIISGTVLLGTLYAIERMPVIREWLDGQPLTLMENGTVNMKLMDKENISQDDLDRVARAYGYSSILVFRKMILEGDGSITGILATERMAERIE